MADEGRTAGKRALALALLGAGEGLILGRGLELCFGIDRYLLILLFGLLGGLGIGTIAWVTKGWWPEPRTKSKKSRGGKALLVLSSAVPALLVFAAYFYARVYPLILEEIKYSR